MVDLLPIQGHGKPGLCTFKCTFVPPAAKASFYDGVSAIFSSLQRSVLLSEWLPLTAASRACVMARIRNVSGPVTGALNSLHGSLRHDERQRRYLRYFPVGLPRAE